LHDIAFLEVIMRWQVKDCEKQSFVAENSASENWVLVLKVLVFRWPNTFLSLLRVTYGNVRSHVRVRFW
jgi:hypothetical protein